MKYIIKRTPFDILVEGLNMKDGRGNWDSFEPILPWVKAFRAACVDSVHSRYLRMDITPAWKV